MIDQSGEFGVARADASQFGDRIRCARQLPGSDGRLRPFGRPLDLVTSNVDCVSEDAGTRIVLGKFRDEPTAEGALTLSQLGPSCIDEVLLFAGAPILNSLGICDQRVQFADCFLVASQPSGVVAVAAGLAQPAGFQVTFRPCQKLVREPCYQPLAIAVLANFRSRRELERLVESSFAKSRFGLSKLEIKHRRILVSLLPDEPS